MWTHVRAAISRAAATTGHAAADPTTSAIRWLAGLRIAPPAEALLDHHFPVFDKFEYHSIDVAAPPDATYRAVLSAPIGDSSIIRALVRIREVPSLLAGKPCDDNRGGTTVKSLIGNGFFLVDEKPGTEIVLGKIGKFWRPLGGGEPAVNDIRLPPPPGAASAVWNFRVEPRNGGSVVHTTTRVRCADTSARRNFGFYWTLIRPFSGLIRLKMLQSIKRTAEAQRS